MQMKSDIYGQQIFSEADLCLLYLQDPLRTIKYAFVEKAINFDDILQLESTPKLIEYVDPKTSVEDFDNTNQSTWYLPPEYLNMDIAKYVLDKCTTEAELQRAGEELIKFQERDMFILLKYLKYLVDTMRKNNVVWGVGRGSSVASFVLFLLEVHRINSLYYDLSIDEFLK
jgi:DNA polymerase III alpha subunit